MKVCLSNEVFRFYAAELGRTVILELPQLLHSSSELQQGQHTNRNKTKTFDTEE